MDISQTALELIEDGHVVGLGTGRAASAFVEALAARVGRGLRVKGIPTSATTAELAGRLGIPLTTLDAVERIDVTVDGADEVDPQLDLIKGYGGALLREKIVAASSDRLVILVGVEKLVPALGTRGVLPVEVVPFGLEPCRRQIERLGSSAVVRKKNGKLVTTDNGNHILDCAVQPIPNAAELQAALRAIPGVVDTGLFIGMAQTVLIQDGTTVERRQRGLA